MENNALIIKVPSRFLDNFGNPINEIIRILPQLNESWSEIIVDFCDCIFLAPHYLGALSCILKMKEEEGVKITLHNESSYLHTIHFKNGFKIDTHTNQEISLENFQTKTYIPIIHFTTSNLKNESVDREQILTAVNSILKNQLKLPINILMGVYYLLDELTQNIVDHSGASSGTIFAQFYPDKKYLDLTICDCGKGLYASYLESDKHKPNSNSEAINFGVYGKSTKNIPESRGFGLNTSRNMLTKGLNGQFFLMTGNDFFIQSAEKEEIINLNDKFDFHGCMIILRIPLFNLEDFSIHTFTDL